MKNILFEETEIKNYEINGLFLENKTEIMQQLVLK
jgi:hypothetical protein